MNTTHTQTQSQNSKNYFNFYAVTQCGKLKNRHQIRVELVAHWISHYILLNRIKQNESMVTHTQMYVRWKQKQWKLQRQQQTRIKWNKIQSHPHIRQEMVRDDFNETIENCNKKKVQWKWNRTHSTNHEQRAEESRRKTGEGKRQIEMIVLIVAEKLRNIIIIKIDVPEMRHYNEQKNVHTHQTANGFHFVSTKNQWTICRYISFVR